MKKFALVLSTLFAVSAQAGGAIVHVNGMVCAFCANGIEKTLKKQKEVESVEVSLETKKVTIVFKGKDSLKDEDLKQLITDSGYSVVSIERN
jgi:mercuric ion binding protein